MKISPPKTGKLLKELQSEIDEAVKKAGLSGPEKGFLNNALIQAKPASAEQVRELLKDPKGTVNKYVEKQNARLSAKNERPATAFQTAMASVAEQLPGIAESAGIPKSELNAALAHSLAKGDKTPSAELAQELLKDPKALVATLKQHQEQKKEQQKDPKPAVRSKRPVPAAMEM